MERMTRKVNGKDSIVIDKSMIIDDGSGYIGEAVNRLASFEDFYYNLLDRQRIIIVEMDKLRAVDKTKSVKFKQLFAEKLSNSNILFLLETYGIK